MRLYTFYPFTEAGVALRFEAEIMPGDEDAIRRAEWLFQRQGALSAVAVWEGTRFVKRVEAGSAGDDSA